MSDFIFVIPEGWTQIPYTSVEEIGSRLSDLVNMRDLGTLADVLREHGDLPMDHSIIDVVFFNGEILAVKLD